MRSLSWQRFLIVVLIIGIFSTTVTTPQDAGSRRIFTKVNFIDSLVGYVVEAQNAAWRHIAPNGREVPAGRAHQQIYETKDGGQTWKQLSLSRGLVDNAVIGGFTINRSGRIAFTSYPNAFEPYIHLSRVSVPQEFDMPGRKFPDAIKKILFIGEPYGWIAGERYLWRTTNGGAQWEKIKLPSFWGDRYSVDPQNVFFVNKGLGYLPVPTGRILKTTDGGKSWTQVGTVQGFVSKVFFVDRDRGWAEGSRGHVYCTTDGGKTWTQQSTGVESDAVAGPPIITTLFFIDTRNGWILSQPKGDSPCILYTADGGTTWIRGLSFQETNLTLFDLHFTDPNNGWIVGSNSTLLKTSDGGRTWTRVPFVLVD